MSNFNDIAEFEQSLAEQRNSYSDERLQAALANLEELEEDSDASIHQRMDIAKLEIFSGDEAKREEAIDSLMSLFYQTGKSQCKYLVALGHYESGRLRQARQTLEEIVKAEPSNEDAIKLRALILRRAKQRGPKFLQYAAAGAVVAAVGLLLVWKGRGRLSGGGSGKRAERGAAVRPQFEALLRDR